MEGLLRSVVHELSRKHEVRVLAQRIDDGPWCSLHDSVKAAPAFTPFVDGNVRIEQLRFSRAVRTVLIPVGTASLPGIRRYEYSRHRIGLARYLAWGTGPSLRAQIGTADVVHMWGADLLGYAALTATRRTTAVRAISPFAHRGQWGTDHASAATYRSADVIVALLESEANLYCSDFNVPRSKVRVCGACSDSAAAGGGPDVRDLYKIEGPLVLFLGARRDYKGVNVLLEAIPHVVRQRPEVAFAFVGPGPALPPVSTDACILDVGEVDSAERASWLRAADLLCLPSAGEILPLSVLEAWSTSTPVLTSDLDTLRELVDGSGGGMTAPRDATRLAEAIVSLTSDPDLLREMGRRGHERWATSYTVSAVAACIEAGYFSARRQA